MPVKSGHGTVSHEGWSGGRLSVRVILLYGQTRARPYAVPDRKFDHDRKSDGDRGSSGDRTSRD